VPPHRSPRLLVLKSSQKQVQLESRITMKKIFLSLMTIFLTHSLFALPVYRSMVSAKKGVLVNCTLCHQPISWELNQHGMDFLKQGRDFKALDVLETLDSDKDGFINEQEWQALSNPGDPASTPKSPGLWLQEAKPTFPPKKILSKIFSGSVQYQVEEEPLSKPTIQSCEQILNRPLRDEEKYPTLFWVIQKETPIGLAAYSIAPIKPTESHILLTIIKNNKILEIHPQHVHTKRLASKKFLDQFKDKQVNELSTIQVIQGLEKESQAMVEAIKATMVILGSLEKNRR
jgi:hypothetical protein